MADQSAVIFGAGKIGRGFIAHLLTLSGYRITFVEKSPELVALLRERGKYTVHILGAPEKSAVIQGFDVLSTEEEETVGERIAAASVVFVSIGGPNLPQIVPHLAAGIYYASIFGRVEPLNILLCEDYFQPAQRLRKLIREGLTHDEAHWFEANVGIVETMVLRATSEPCEEMRNQDPLSLQSQDIWEMPVDSADFAGAMPAIRGLAPKKNFQR